MKICGGTAKGMKLSSPKGMATRPMIERVKIALFNIIGAEINDARVLDLFSGSGSLGLEALSRGAISCYFVENGKPALAALKENLQKMNPDTWRLLVVDAFLVKKVLTPEDCFDIFFMDPPYKCIDNPQTRKQTLEFMADLLQHHGSEDSLVVLHCRRYATAGVPLPPGLVLESKRDYGSTELLFLRRS